SIRCNSGEYGGRYLMTHPCFFQEGIRCSHSSLVCIDALSMITTVFFVIVCQNASKQAITTPVWIDCSNIEACKSLWRFINPHTLIRPYFMAGSSMTLSGSCQAYGMVRSSAKPDSSK